MVCVLALLVNIRLEWMQMTVTRNLSHYKLSLNTGRQKKESYLGIVVSHWHLTMDFCKSWFINSGNDVLSIFSNIIFHCQYRPQSVTPFQQHCQNCKAPKHIKRFYLCWWSKVLTVLLKKGFQIEAKNDNEKWHLKNWKNIVSWTLSIQKFSIMINKMLHSSYDTQHNGRVLFMLSFTYAKCHIKAHYAEFWYAECHGANCCCLISGIICVSSISTILNRISQITQ